MPEINTSLLYMLCNIITTYVVYRFMHICLDFDKTNRKLEIMSYALYYLFSVLNYLVIHIPIVTLVSNLAAFFLISFNYNSSIKEKIFASVYIYSVLGVIEMLVGVLEGYVHLPMDEKVLYASSFGLITSKLFSLMVVIFISVHQKTKKEAKIPAKYWVSLIMIPVFSVYFVVLVFHLGVFDKNQIVPCMIFLLLLNGAVMYLHEFIMKSMLERTEKLLLEQQNKYYQRQFEQIKTSFKVIKSLEHDLNNHFITLRSLLAEQDLENAFTYVDEMIQTKRLGSGRYSNTGNFTVDSILNFKLQEAEERGIQISSRIQIPEELGIAPFDLTILLGNLLDNAITAAGKSPQEKILRLSLLYDRNCLLIKIDNTFDGTLVKEKGGFRTRKQDKKSHGIGLQNVKAVGEKYNGTLEIETDSNWFRASLLLYMEEGNTGVLFAEKND